MKSVKRNKKYNPNKLQHQKLSKTVEQCKNWQALDVLYEFEMDFVVEKVNKIINAYAEENNLADDDYTPAEIIVEAYEQQDLIIVLKKQMIKTPESWEVGIDSHFYNQDTEEVHTIPFALDLPSMSHEELMAGCKAKVMLVDGIKTVKGEWQGLQAEMLNHWEKQGVPDGFDLIQSQVRIKALAHFKDMDFYNRHLRYFKLRDEGCLIDALKAESMIETCFREKLSFVA